MIRGPVRKQRSTERHPDVPELVRRLTTGEAPVRVALAAWRTFHGLRLSDVSQMIGYDPNSVSAWLHAPDRLPGVERGLRGLMNYPARKVEKSVDTCDEPK